MFKGCSIRLKPNKEQEQLMFKFANTARFAYNECLAYRIDRYTNQGLNTTVQECIEHIQDLKRNNPDYKWINETPEAMTKYAIKCLDKAYKSFFKKNKGFPKFKSRKYSKIAFHNREDRLRQVDTTHMKISGIKQPVKCNRCVLPKKVQNPNVKFDGKYWYLTYSYEVSVSNQSLTDDIVGIDLGIKDFATLSNGKVYENINHTTKMKKLERRKKRLQRQISHKYECNKQGNKFIKTQNIKKLEHKLKLLDRHISNKRDTYIHTITAEIVRTKPSKVVLEDLQVKNLMKNKYLAKSIQEQEWYKFRQYLTYKCQFNGIEVVIADKYYPSSQLCSCCGYKNKQVKNLSIREWICPNCNTHHDRDYNASVNLMKYA